LKVVVDLPDDRALALAQRHEAGELDAALADAVALYCGLENPDELVGGDNS